MKFSVLRQDRHATIQGHRCDESVGRISVTPAKLSGQEPIFRRRRNPLHTGQKLESGPCLPEGHREGEFPGTPIVFQLPKRDGGYQKSLRIYSRLLGPIAGCGRQTKRITQPPVKDVRIEKDHFFGSGAVHHVSSASSCSRHSGSIMRSLSMESAVLFPNKLARNFAKISAFEPVCGRGRISKTLRPWSVTINGSPVRSTSRKYSSILLLSFPFEMTIHGK